MKKIVPFILLIFIVAACCKSQETAEKKEVIMQTKREIPTVKLNNGVNMPQLGVGTWTLKGDTAKENVREALKAGFRLVDCAQGYGNEHEVGEGIRESGVPREEIFVTTKIAPNIMREHKVAESIDESLEKLGTGYIDLLLIHWPVKDEIEVTWKIMEEYVKKGKVRSIGLSNFNPHHIDSLLQYAEIKPVINQIEIHPYMSQQEVAGQTFMRGIQVESWGPLGQGTNSVLNDPAVTALAEKYQKTPAQIVLRWDIERGLVTIPRALPEHFAENLDVLDFTLSAADIAILNGLNRNERTNEKNDPDSFPW